MTAEKLGLGEAAEPARAGTWRTVRQGRLRRAGRLQR